MHKKLDTELLRRTVTDWGKVLVLLLDEAAVLVVVILILKFLGIRMPLSITIPIVIIGGIFVFIIHLAVIPSFHRKKVTTKAQAKGKKSQLLIVVFPLHSF